jgi:hypothetical protein
MLKYPILEILNNPIYITYFIRNKQSIYNFQSKIISILILRENFYAGIVSESRIKIND